MGIPGGTATTAAEQGQEHSAQLVLHMTTMARACREEDWETARAAISLAWDHWRWLKDCLGIANNFVDYQLDYAAKQAKSR